MLNSDRLANETELRKTSHPPMNLLLKPGTLHGNSSITHSNHATLERLQETDHTGPSGLGVVLVRKVLMHKRLVPGAANTATVTVNPHKLRSSQEMTALKTEILTEATPAGELGSIQERCASGEAALPMSRNDHLPLHNVVHNLINPLQ